MFAYCFQSGEIYIGRRVPKGAIPIRKGRKKDLEKLLDATATLAYDNKTLLVPGIRLAETPEGKLKALLSYIKWLDGRKP